MGDSVGDECDDRLAVSNEYAQVVVRKVSTAKGERIEIRSPKLGHSIRLDPVELESLTWQEKSLFSEFLLTPYGPDGAEGADGEGGADDR